MKNKAQWAAVTIILLAAGIEVCFFLFNMVDTVFNGAFVEWFEKKYMIMDYGYNSVTGMEYFTWRMRWSEFKKLVLQIMIVLLVLCVTGVRLFTWIRVRREKKQMVSATGRMIRDYMHGDREAAEIFPEEYAEISLQVAEMKSTMQRHEQILKEESGRKNDLITYLAHDLKTPLTSVIGYLSLLQEAPDMPDKQKAKYIDITLDKALRLEKLINEFFEITRYNLQQISIERETIDLNYMLMQMTDEFYPILQDHGNRVELQTGGKIEIHADAEKMARVFNNILKNAVAYSYSNTSIQIQAENITGKCGEEQVKISFQNQGKTIPKQKLDSIFEKFFRLDEARTTNTGGAGLGLAIAREIVTLHGGTITADSGDEVTTFTVILPL